VGSNPTLSAMQSFPIAEAIIHLSE